MSDFYSQSAGCLDHLYLFIPSVINQYEIVIKSWSIVLNLVEYVATKNGYLLKPLSI